MIRFGATPARVGIVCISGWVLIVAVGMVGLIGDATGLVRGGTIDEGSRRVQAWGPIFGLATACKAGLPSNARIVLIDPVEYTASNASSGMPPNVSVPDLGIFEYVMYPRTTVTSDIPAAWDSAAFGDDYLALWADSRWQSDSLVARVSAARESLRGDRRWQEICSFDFEGHASGSMFHVVTSASQIAASIPTADELRLLENYASYIRTIVGILAMWAIGALVSWGIARRHVTAIQLASLSLPLGGLIVAVQLLVLSLVGIRWSLTTLVVPWLIVAAAIAARSAASRSLRRDLLDIGRALRASTQAQLRRHELVPLAVLAVLAIGLLVLAPRGLPANDGLQIYFFRARSFFTDASAVPYYARAAELVFTIPAHPPLVPLEITWLFEFIGGVDEHATLIFWPALLLSMMGGVYSLSREHMARPHALWLTAAVSLAGYHSLAEAAWFPTGYADLPVAVYFLLGAGLLSTSSSHSDPRPRIALLGGLLLGAAALAKEEGVAMAVGAAVWLAFLAVRGLLVTKNRRAWVDAAGAAGVAIAILALALIRWRFPAPELLIGNSWTAPQLLERVGVVAAGLALRAAVAWAPLVLLLTAVVLIRLMPGRTATLTIWPGVWFLLCLVGLQLAADSAGMVLTPYEAQTEVSITASRLLTQVVALPFLATAGLFNGVLSAALSARPGFDR